MDARSSIPSEDDENLADYLPWAEGLPVGYNMYRTLRKLGRNHVDAMLEVYSTARLKE